MKDLKKQNVLERPAEDVNKEKNKGFNEDEDSNSNKKSRR